MDKIAQRKKMKALRDSYSLEERLDLDAIICYQILAIAQEHQHIGIYVSFGSEVDTTLIIDALLYGHHVYVPKVVGKGQMIMVEIKSFDDLLMSDMGFLEPISNIEIDPQILDIVLIPLLGYNMGRCRLGYGGGYYDRYLAKTKAFRIGLAYSFQLNEDLICEAHDAICNVIVTETEVVA